MEERGVRTIDPSAQHILKKAEESNIETGWSRFDEMQDPCGFGDLGLCCRICMMGPCRIDPFGEGPQKGICGISADGIVARNLARMIAGGTSAHSDHGAHIVETLEFVANGESTYYRITDKDKLIQVALKMGLEVEGKELNDILHNLIDKIKESYSCFGGESEWLRRTLPKPRLEKLQRLRVVPSSIDPVIRETMHRTHMGVDADPVNILLGGIKCSVADFLGMDISTAMSDILLGTPTLNYSYANLGVLEKDAVNVAVHGHNPLISEAVISAAARFRDKAVDAGASKGVNVVGVCCTGNEVLMRRAVPLASNFASQELTILTGAMDAMVVDVQCIMPSLGHLCDCYHTQLITTVAAAKIPGAKHIEFDAAQVEQTADKILETAVEAYKNRDPKKVDIPEEVKETLVGFSTEAVVSVLQKLNADDPLQPLIDKIVTGEIYGIVLFAGCNNFRVPQDSAFVTIAERLIKDNILVVATGCAAGAFARRGLLSPRATDEQCGDALKGVLNNLGKTAGIKRPFPPVWHMGSCVDNSRPAQLAFALANKLGVDTDQLPIVASAPEAMSEKSVSIGTWTVAMGLTTHLGVVPPVLGGKVVTKVLTETAKDLLGSSFIIETDPFLAVQKIKDTITKKRIGLGLDA
jgi:anaerobic carbon-monoxide dehydrogenase catalytic subunit